MCDISDPLVQFQQAGFDFGKFLDSGSFKQLLIFGVGGTIAVVAIVFTTMKNVLVNRSREQTKRELAAYVAEGTLDPDKAIAMLNAKPGSDDDSCC